MVARRVRREALLMRDILVCMVLRSLYCVLELFDIELVSK